MRVALFLTIVIARVSQLLLPGTFLEMCFLCCSIAKGGEPRVSFTQVSGSHTKKGLVLGAFKSDYISAVGFAFITAY